MNSQITHFGNRDAPRAYSYIRFSTPDQLKGDSLRRQLDASTAYAAEHGLILDEHLNMRDLGVSAFRGANIEKGRLGAFIKAVEAGLVERGSYLLVESLDRLSRAEVMDALEVFLAIVNRGITIVTLLDNRIYSRESLRENSTELIISIVVMSRAFDESVTKSKRRHKTWNQQKRLAEATGKKITRKLPFWLSLPDPSGDFVINEEAADVVRRVFGLAKSGLGYYRIIQMLNTEGVPSPASRKYATDQKYKGNPRTWSTSSIGYLLRNEAVIGNLVMPEAAIEDGEAPVPHRLDGYYPSIIDSETFYTIQGKRKSPSGRASTLKLNLFTGLLYCGYCRGPMQVDTNVKSEVRRSRIACQRKRRGMSCICKTWPYEDFEESFFRFVLEVDVSSIVEPNRQNKALAGEIAELSGRLAVNNKNLERLLRIAEKVEKAPIDSLIRLIRERESDQARLENELRTRQAVFNAESNYQSNAGKCIDEIRGQFRALSLLPNEKQVIVRSAIAELIAAIVESIELLPSGTLLQSCDGGEDDDDDDDEAGWSEPDTRPIFVIKFRNGWHGCVSPSEEVSHRMDLRSINIPGLRKRGGD